MAKSDKPCGSNGKVTSTEINNNVEAKKSSSSKGLKPQNMYWATKYHDKIPNELVLIQFDDAMMKALQLNPNKSK